MSVLLANNLSDLNVCIVDVNFYKIHVIFIGTSLIAGFV